MSSPLPPTAVSVIQPDAGAVSRISANPVLVPVLYSHRQDSP